MSPLTYKDAGVDINRDDGFASGIYRLMRKTFCPRVIENRGGFAGLFSLDYDTRLFAKNYRHPILVGCTDGVGTKLKIAFMMDKHDTVGIDLVAMCVNDLVVQGAEPLFFLDYLASSNLADEKRTEIIKGISHGCYEADCALLGGETASLPGFYRDGEYELAGFAVGVAEKDKLIDGSRSEPGDMIIGLRSNGLHSNGFSLVRKVFFECAKMGIDSHVEELGTTLGEELLKPTRIYVRAVKHILASYRVKKIVKGIAHITGGGLVGNIPRILPGNCKAVIDKSKWEVPPIFLLVQKLGAIEDAEMQRVFNMGIGMVLIVAPYYADAVVRRLRRFGEDAVIIGEIRLGERYVEMSDGYYSRHRAYSSGS